MTPDRDDALLKLIFRITRFLNFQTRKTCLSMHITFRQATVHYVCQYPPTVTEIVETWEGWYHYSCKWIKKTPKLWECGYCAQQQLHGHYGAARGATRYLLAAEILSEPCRKFMS